MKNVDDQSRSLTTKKKKKEYQDGKRRARFDLLRLVCIMPWNFSVGLKSDAAPLCSELSFIKSRIFEVVLF